MTTVVNVKTDDYDVYVGRPSQWGNPFMIGRDGTREEVIEKFRGYLKANPGWVNMIRKELRGKRLGCFCKPLACHGDVLAEVADSHD